MTVTARKQFKVAVPGNLYGRDVDVGDDIGALVDDATAASLEREGYVVVEKDPPSETQPADPALDALRSEAAELGVRVDGRWKADRLTEEIAKAKAAAAGGAA